jgi:hypothetical protein
MVLGSQQYIFRQEQNIEYVVLCHHPLDWFKDEDAAMPTLRSRGRMIMAGHEHKAAFRKVEEAGSEYLVIDAGATNPPGGKTRYPHAYNWVEFSLSEESGRFNMAVTVYPRVWSTDRASFQADSTRIGGVTSETFSVKCPNYRALAPSDAIPAATSSRVPIGVIDSESAPMAEDQRFAQLLYFFWRYLDWQQRYGVLAKLEILPQGLDKPMPQVVERSALASAKAQQKLGAVWDEVMQYVPETDRQNNPY